MALQAVRASKCLVTDEALYRRDTHIKDSHCRQGLIKDPLGLLPLLLLLLLLLLTKKIIYDHINNRSLHFFLFSSLTTTFKDFFRTTKHKIPLTCVFFMSAQTV